MINGIKIIIKHTSSPFRGRRGLFFLLLLLPFFSFSQPKFTTPLYGAAYYYEYMPYERLDKDVQMMKECSINVVRIGESTWAVLEPHDGQFDFTDIDKVIDAMGKAGIKVIVGTPTYAIPAWMAKAHPDILATTLYGKNQYGGRQNMDIANKWFRFYAERVVRKLIAHVKDNPAVIGYQADNETKHYNVASDTVQAMFVQYLKNKFKTVENINNAFGLNYWSNSITSWEDFPPMSGNINASLGAEFSKFQRKLVTDYLAWQASIINEYRRPDQFVTQNFDLEWRGYSFGIQPDVDHFAAAKAFDIAGIDIYHPTEDELTGIEISFGGDVARSMKRNNYLVMETQAQSINNSFSQQLPYPGQLRLQAYSHLASGANMVSYWPWHSIHNSYETYWKGILSHDMEPNPTYYEVQKIANEWKQAGGHLVNLKKKNKVAFLVSNESLTALNWFPFSRQLNYNDIVRQLYDALYNMNVSCDFVNTSSDNIEDYSLLIVPPLYAVADSVLMRLNEYVKRGGHILYAFKSGVSNENNQVRSSRMPGLLREACGFYYQQFTNAEKLQLKDTFNIPAGENYVTDCEEFLVPETAKVLAWYDHEYWNKYAAITENNFGKGVVTYFGAVLSKAVMRQLLIRVIKGAGLWGTDQQINFPIIVKHGINQYAKTIHYYFNYSDKPQTFIYPYHPCINLLTKQTISTGQRVTLEPWGLVVLEEDE